MPRRNRSISRPCRTSVTDTSAEVAGVPFSLVVTIKNEGPGIEEWLTSVLEQAVQPDELVVVDGGSRDDTLDNIERWLFTQRLRNNGSLPFPVRVKRMDGASIAQGRNIGAVIAQFEHVLFTDAGCVLDSEWTREMLRPFTEDKATEVVKGYYAVDAPEGFLGDVSRILTRPLETIDPDSFLPSARSLAITKTVFLRVGGFPTYLSHAGEDTYFSLGALQLSDNHAFAPAAITTWGFPNTVIGAFKTIRGYAQGDAEAGVIGWGHYVPQLSKVAGAAIEVALFFFSIIGFALGMHWLIALLIAGEVVLTLWFRAKQFFLEGRARFHGQEVARERSALLFVALAESIGFLRGLFLYAKCERDRIRQAQSGVVFVLTDKPIAFGRSLGEVPPVLSHSISLSEEGWLVLLHSSSGESQEPITHPRIELLQGGPEEVSSWLERVLREREAPEISYLIYADDEELVEPCHRILREASIARMQNTNASQAPQNGTHPQI